MHSLGVLLGTVIGYFGYKYYIRHKVVQYTFLSHNIIIEHIPVRCVNTL
jgi:hypothetical protein